jgi:phage tail sheath protein FI
MAELLSSKIIINEEEPKIRTFPVLPSAVLAIQGIAERGPIATSTLLTSFEEYSETFGNLLAGYELPVAVRAFFLNGGQQCYVSRVVHYTDYTSDTTPASAAKGTVTLQTTGGVATSGSVTGTVAGPWELQPADDLKITTDLGGPTTSAFDAAAGTVTDTTTYPVADQDTLTEKVTIDGGTEQTVTFSGTTTTAAQIAAQMNAQLTGCSVDVVGGQVEISSDKKGTASTVVIGTGTCALTWAAPVDGTGDVADISAVTAAEAKTVLEADVTGITVSEHASGYLIITRTETGSTKTVQVDVTSTAETVFGLDTIVHAGTDSSPQDTLTMDGTYYGAYANNYKIKILDASSLVASEFNLYVMLGTDVKESFPDITMDDTEDRYAETIINNADSGSLLFTATDEGATGSPTAIRPANTSGATVALGDDGLASLDDNDFIGSAAGSTGFYAFDNSADATILASPDRTAAGVQSALADYCGDHRDGLLFGLLDPIAGQAAATVISGQLAGISTNYKENVALYWPRIKIVNPSTTVYGTDATITVCPSGYIAGIAARNDRDEPEGPFYNPAGVEGGKPTGVVDLETDEAALMSKRDLVYPKRINPITWMEGYGVFVDGSRTLRGDGNFPSIGERRGVSYIERQLQLGLQWVRHRNNTPELRTRVEGQVYALLHGWMSAGAFASDNPATAFFVDVSAALNTASVIRAGKLVMRIGMATNTPAEFIVIKVTKDTRALEEELYA